MARRHGMPCPLKEVLLPGLKVYNVVTCYDPIHLLQGCCQHLAGVRHHLVLNDSERGKMSENHKGKDKKDSAKAKTLRKRESALKSTNGKTGGSPKFTVARKVRNVSSKQTIDTCSWK